MKIKFQKEKLEKAINDFYHATGVRLAVLDSDYVDIVPAPDAENAFCKIIKDNDANNRCYLSDRKILEECSRTRLPQMHICHAGLIDIALPILHNDAIMGYIIMGQMRRDIPFERIEERLSWIQADMTWLKSVYSDMVIYDDRRAESLAELAVMLASYIMTEDMIKEEHNILTEKVTSYIHEHIHENISVTDICRNVSISKNTLYRSFRNSLGVSVNEYIINERIKLAKRLLKESKEPISRICEQVGIANSSYFCKLFKEKNGVTPLKYRSSD